LLQRMHEHRQPEAHHRPPVGGGLAVVVRHEAAVQPQDDLAEHQAFARVCRCHRSDVSAANKTVAPPSTPALHGNGRGRAEVGGATRPRDWHATCLASCIQEGMHRSGARETMSDPRTLSELKHALCDGTLTVQQLMRRVLDEQAIGAPQAWIALAAREALFACAADCDRQLQAHGAAAFDAQPLLGMPFAVKDNIDVAGLPTTAACPSYATAPAASHAAAVQRLVDAGAIPVGKTNLDQFATGLVGTRSPFGAVPNPFSAAHVSGGSSSGSAYAVATGQVPFALGTDTAGSGRVPAGFCNISGLK